ncbi:GNAT family N-acetyltransferase [Nonomuraea sp. NPDC048916]|uniref:GNAT family N-acetyltransferase n=1 Tax=Nonomuraea sp. NPDC048916 TaxID=3154232 RepID=UPI003403F62D
MFPREVISSGSLVLRAPAGVDAESIVMTCDDPVTAEFLPTLPAPYTLRDAHSYLAAAAAKWECGGAEFAITENGRYVGAVGVSEPDEQGTVEMGYLVAPWARGKGVASTAARAVAEWLFDRGVHRVELQAMVENIASLRVACKAGFTEEGRRRDAKLLRDGSRTDFIIFARLAHDSGESAPPYLPPFEGGELSDGVVLLVPLAPDDAGDFHRMLAEPSVAEYKLGPATTLEEDRRRCRYTGYWWASGQRIEVAVRDAASGAFAGHLQLMQVTPVLGQAMIGYSLRSAFRGRGFMTRAVRLLTDWAFANTVLHRIVAGTDVANTASQAVLERAGFSRESVLRELFPRPDGTRADDVEWVRLRPR